MNNFWKIFLVSSLSLILLFSFLFFMLPTHTELTHTENVDKKQSEQIFQFNKNPEIQQVKPKKPVRIKLKRTAKGIYSWDLTGDCVDEILKIDRRLRRSLKSE